MNRKNIVACCAAFTLIATGGLLIYPNSSAKGQTISHGSVRNSAVTKTPTGKWYAVGTGPNASQSLHNAIHAATANAVSAKPNSIAPPPGGGGGGYGCPSGTTKYSGSKNIWDCMSVTKDNGGKGHGVWLRVGRSGGSGFGYLHALIDHNLGEQSVAAVVYNNSHGIIQKNGRYLYGMYFKSPNGVIQQVNVFAQRTKGSGSPDSHELGVVTGYCLSAAGTEENKCPEWVNETL